MRLTIKMSLLCFVCLYGCSPGTKNIFELRGKVVDEFTKEPIPARSVIIKGIPDSSKTAPVYVGQFMSDSEGCFTYTANKLKNIRMYGFYFSGDSDYISDTQLLTLYDIEKFGKFISFPMKRLTDFTIKINRKSKTPACDTLVLYWDSDGIDGRKLYPYKTINQGITPTPELYWMGGKVMSTIKTKVFAEKKVTILWELYRNGRIKKVTDTITCSRYLYNSANFTY